MQTTPIKNPSITSPIVFVVLKWLKFVKRKGDKTGMEITIKAIKFSCGYRDVAVGECKIIHQVERQSDGSILLRVTAVHNSGIPIPLRVNEGWEHIEFAPQPDSV